MGILSMHEMTSCAIWIFMKWRHGNFEYSQSAVMGILKAGVMGILNIHIHYYEYSKNDVILNIKNNNVTMNIQNTHKFLNNSITSLRIQNTNDVTSCHVIFKMSMTPAFEHSKCPWRHFMNIQSTRDLASWIFKTTHDGTFWIFKMPMRSLHEYSNTHDFTSSIFKPSCHLMNILN